ncbi:MFS transporter [Pseudoduganella violaceinigra]|uniref:MFS transporter n=1 Tax=Pseudoduganella violaceinigra TaxID=246602 RepID=UPI0004880A29|nr:MFS transporter [Pseudoduganella violaceinigra]
MPPRTHALLSLASLATLGPLAFDAFLPALPALGKEFDLPLPALQSLLALYLAALATSHLLSAWAANVLGKRAVLLAATLLFCLGCAVCALAVRPVQLQAGRILQGLGAGAAAAFLPLLLQSRSRRALRLLAEGAIPILAPCAGAWFVLEASWRHTFWLAAAAGLLVIVLVALAPAAAHKADERFQFAELTGNITFWRYAACHALSFGALAAGMASLPVLVMLDLRLDAGRLALLQCAGALAMLVPALKTMQSRLWGPTNNRLTGGFLLMVCAAVMAASWSQMEDGVDPFQYLLGCWAVMCAGFSMCATPLAAGALQAAGRHARAGLSLLQFVTHATAAAAILLTARGNVEFAGGIAFGCAALMVFAACLALPGFVWRNLSRGE